MPRGTNITGIIYSAIFSVKWDQLTSPPTLKIMDEKFIASLGCYGTQSLIYFSMFF